MDGLYPSSYLRRYDRLLHGGVHRRRATNNYSSRDLPCTSEFLYLYQLSSGYGYIILESSWCVLTVIGITCVVKDYGAERLWST